MSDLPQVPGYELQAELGRGGMAVVYSAIETNLGRYVAIKVVTARDEVMEGQIERLENEARGLAALHHPHIVDLYRFGRTSDGALYYVMPLLPGGSLEDWPKPVSEERVVALLDPLLDALGHAHAEGIIHRDIKPANILFDQHNRPLLADFGAAFMRGRSTRLTGQGIAIGSSGYMSPEQARGFDVDARSDIYSTAVLAFELLTGQRPFDGPDDLAVAVAQSTLPVPKLPDALRHWQPFFVRALAVKPEQRFADVAAMRAAIHALRHSSSTGARASPRLLMALVAGVVLLGALVLAIRWWNRPIEPVRAEPVAVAAHLDPSTPPVKPEVPVVEAPHEIVPEVPAIPKVGDHFTDAGEPELVLAREAKGSHPPLAVMAAAVDAAMYRRFAKDRGRTLVKCSDKAAPAQGCLELATANDIASWLSKQSGQKYRVPTRSELTAVIAQVETAPAYAWTNTCNEVRVELPRKAGSRAWSGVKKLFGKKPPPPKYETRCEGHFTLKLDGHDGAARVREQSSPETVVVLVREMAR